MIPLVTRWGLVRVIMSNSPGRCLPRKTDQLLISITTIQHPKYIKLQLSKATKLKHTNSRTPVFRSNQKPGFGNLQVLVLCMLLILCQCMYFGIVISVSNVQDFGAILPILHTASDGDGFRAGNTAVWPEMGS